MSIRAEQLQIQMQNDPELAQYHHERLTLQRLTVSDYLEAFDSKNNLGNHISYAFVAIPKAWTESAPPESLVATLRNNGYALHWLNVPNSVPAAILLPNELLHGANQ